MSPGKTPPSKGRPDKADPNKARPGKARPGKARPGKARPGKARPGKARPGKARPSETPSDHARFGRVRWFSPDKGYGFIVEDGTTEDVFVHYTAIQTPGFKVLPTEQRVAFVRVTGERGPTARDVVPLEEA